jgi:nucleotide-binding universal stress UspA family protein
MSEERHYHILHPTDNTKESLSAFAHGVQIAAKARGRFTVLHVDDDDEAHWSDMPGVRDMLIKWGTIKGYEDQGGMEAIGLGVKKVIAKGEDPAGVTLSYMEDHPMDLVVLGTHQDQGWKRWTRTQVAEPIARESAQNALFIPASAKGFISPDTGEVHLNRVLIPVAAVPNARDAVEALVELVRILGVEPPTVILLHISDGHRSPARDLRFPEGWDVTMLDVQGEVVSKILEGATEYRIDLLVMTTKGHDGFLDMLRGSRTEQVLREADFAVLAVPEK